MIRLPSPARDELPLPASEMSYLDMRARRTVVCSCQRNGKRTKSSVDLPLLTWSSLPDLSLPHSPPYLSHQNSIARFTAHSKVEMAQHLSNTPINVTDTTFANTAAPKKPTGGGGGEPPRRPGRDATRGHYLQAMSLWELRKQCVHWLFLTHTYRA